MHGNTLGIDLMSGTLSLTSDGGFITTGRLRQITPGLSDYAYLLKTDSLGTVFNNELTGHVFQDNNNNCLYDTLADLNWKNAIVQVDNPNGLALYTVTDSLGHYNIQVDTGTHWVSIHATSPYHQLSCTPQQAVTFTGSPQQQQLDLTLTPTGSCPLLEVDISAPFIRPTGGGSHYTVSYCNKGTAPASNAYIEVEIDSLLTVLNTSIPPTSQTNNTYTFFIGNVGINDCNSFQIKVIADSTSLPGQAVCSKAHIFPDSICLPNYWNGPILSVNALCQSDTVYFDIHNQGSSMSQGHTYYVYEDNIMLRTGTTGLIPSNGHEQVIQPASLGKTYRLEVGQAINFPPLLGNSFAAAAIPNCNTAPAPSIGFIDQFDNNNSAPSVANDCQPIITSYDPNDKAAQPKGYGNDHYINTYTDLYYKIRFQNTGTDTAFLVVIRDTLPANLNPASLVMGAASHPYTWRIYGDNILEVTFANILLPDSSTNELASNGFFKFKISQQDNNPIGTVIHNSAAIYFDYNPPVITNQTVHTIGERFVSMQLLDVATISDNNAIKVTVYPNPFKGQTTIELEEAPYQTIEIGIYDLTGKLVQQQQSNEHKIQLEATNLTQGLYFYQLKGDGKRFHTGRLIVQ